MGALDGGEPYLGETGSIAPDDFESFSENDDVFPCLLRNESLIQVS